MTNKLDALLEKYRQPVEEINPPDPIPLDTASPRPMGSDIFTGWLGDMIEAEARATETPRELPAMFALAVLGCCCQKKFIVRPEQGYFEPVNIWTVTALDPGNRKSAVMRVMTAPLLEWEREQAEALGPEIKRATSTTESMKARIDELRAKAAKAKDNADFDRFNGQILELEEGLPEIPELPRLWGQDITPEKCGTLMAQNDERLAIFSAEGGIFDILAGRYSNGIPNLDLFLQAHSGDMVRVDRGSREPVFMAHPALTIGLSPQPDVLRGMANKPGFRGRGLLGRFLYALPVSPMGFRKLEPQPIPSHIREAYNNHVRALIDMKPATGEDGQSRPHVLILSSEAWREWKEFSRALETKLREGGKFEHITDWAGKLPGAAIRISGLLHCALHARGEPWAQEISKDTMSRALTIAAILSDHALAVFDMMGADPALESARKVWRWVERQRLSTFSARECFQALKGSFRRMADFEPVLDVLVERAYLLESAKGAPIAPAKKHGPGRPSRILTVNPSISSGWV